MANRSRVFTAIILLLFVFVAGVVVLVFGVRYIASRVPADAVLTVDLEGSLPEASPQTPLTSILTQPPLSRRDLRDALVKAEGDPRIRAVRVRVGNLTSGWATAQEVRQLLVDVGKAGKKTFAYMETAGEGAPGNLPYFVASACEKVVLNPMGDVNLVGLRIETPFIRDMLDRLGIEPEFPGIGDYKTARFFYTDKGFTPAGREMSSWLLQSLSEQLESGIAEGRNLAPERVHELITQGPFLASQAVDAKLVDQLSDWDDFVEEAAGGDGGARLTAVSLDHYLRSGRPDDHGRLIAVVRAEGTIMRGESGYSPMPVFGGDVMGSDTIAQAWHDVRADHPAAVIFRIDSPGGSALASEIIRLEMEKTAAKVPVVVSMGNVAASGGYWITCGAQKVVADPGTITASIGVFAGHLAMSDFWSSKLGVTWGTISATPNADIYGSLTPWTAEQREQIQGSLDRTYQAFLQRVSKARNMSAEQVDAMGRGRVFTGEQAKARGLVDSLGSFEDALAEARSLAGIAPDSPVALRFYPQEKSFWQRLLERETASAGVAGMLQQLLSGQLKVPGPVWQPPLQIQ